jgi:protein DGCR14
MQIQKALKNSQKKEIIGTFNGQEIFKPATPSHLMPLPDPKPAKAVEEDEYVLGIEKIIQRDFFPDLGKLRVQKELALALDDQDEYRASNLAFTLAKMTGNIIEAPSEKEGIRVVDDGQGQSLTMNTNLRLDQFQSNYTSEDNLSFNVLIGQENQKKKEAYGHFYPSEQRLLETTSKMLIEGVSKPINTWKHAAKSALMYGPEGAKLTAADLPAGRGADKSLDYASTRFKHSLAAAPPEEVLKKMGERAHTQQVWSNMASQTPGLFPIKGSETPSVGGWKLVPDTPDLKPGEDVDPSELITWGMMESMPLLLDSGKGPNFSIAPTPKRDLLAKKLGEQATQSLKKKQDIMSGGSSSRKRMGTPGNSTPGGVFKKPLARHQSPALAALTMRLTGRSSSAASSLQASYSPAINRNPQGVTPVRKTPGKDSHTPSFQVMTPMKNISGPKEPRPLINVETKVDRKSITDDLLND